MTILSHMGRHMRHSVGSMGWHHGQISHNYIFFQLGRGTADTGPPNDNYEIRHGHRDGLSCMSQYIQAALFHNKLADRQQQHHNDIAAHQMRHLDIGDSSPDDIAPHIDIRIQVFCYKL